MCAHNLQMEDEKLKGPTNSISTSKQLTQDYVRVYTKSQAWIIPKPSLSY